MPSLVAVVSELADLMAVGAPDVEEALKVISVHGADVGIHLIVATERPSLNVLTDIVRHGLSTRIALRTASRNDSRVILGETGAEQLLGGGDMLVSISGGPPLRVHGAAVMDDEVARVVAQLRPGSDVPPPVTGPSGATVAVAAVDPALPVNEDSYEKAVAIAARARRVSVAILEQKLGADRGEVLDILARLQRNGLVGPADMSGWHMATSETTSDRARY
jgi:S-DNA-T family DNA segregation ATPase FtsK/SpoIIIE